MGKTLDQIAEQEYKEYLKDQKGLCKKVLHRECAGCIQIVCGNHPTKNEDKSCKADD